MSRKMTATVVPDERVFNAILILRGRRVILDSDLARFYGVEVRRMNEAVRRNADRFPDDFTFVLSSQELAYLKSQSATSSSHGGKRKPPRAFTEHGALMVATLLNSPLAVQMSVFVVRAFVKMREEFAGHRELAVKLAALERNLSARLDGHEQAIQELVETVRLLMEPAVTTTREPIGFRETGSRYSFTPRRSRSART